MAGVIIDGKGLAKKIQGELAAKAAEVEKKIGRKAGLAVVLVGDNPASQVYVRSKTKTARSVGIEVADVVLPATVSNEVLQEELRRLSSQPDIDGILLQLPLPKHLDEYEALFAIHPSRDVDGLHPLNQGLLMRGAAKLKACTPLGVMALIDDARSQLGLSPDLSGLSAVVIGRSVLVGKPIAQMLLERHCTVTMCHSRSRDLAGISRQADILIAAVGRPQIVKKDWVKSGAIVIDVGINRLESGKIVGDVDTTEVLAVAGAVTPVPGGVGPMTITMLLANTLVAAQCNYGN